MLKQLFVLLILLVLTAACGGRETADPAPAVEAFLEAKAASDGDTLRRLLCAELESTLEREQTTFAGVSGVQTEGMTCQQVGDSDTVTCEGAIVALYGTEETRFPLGNYRVVEEDGEWKWCGRQRKR
ncbi:MAG: hypothetical protein IPL28_15455 [Chloroflexi bacterium]|nr:hypothetical protein [Chloroflexota bacterium]